MKPIEILFVILLSVGAIQGVVYGTILWKNNTNKTANRFLATILFFFSYRLIVEILKLFGVGYYDFWYHILLEYNWVYGALIYFFVKAYVTPNFKLRLKHDWIHFLPVATEFAWSNFIKSQNFYWDGTRESLSWLGYWGYVVWMQYPTIYIICAALIIYYCFKAEKLLTAENNTSASIIYDNVKWISRILKVLKFYSILIIVVVLIDLIFFNYAFNRFYHYPLFIGMALITYWIGIEGFTRRNLIGIKLKNNLSAKEKEQLFTIEKKLNKLMEEDKIYKDPGLTLTSLSKKIGVKTYLTSKCLSVIIEKKFSDYVNEYRIEELKHLLSLPKNNHFTLLALAYEAGFNSKASFNRAVKKITGKPPSALKS